VNRSFSITNRKGDTFQVLVSADKYDEVMQYRWYIKIHGEKVYVARNMIQDGKMRSFYLHWQIMGKPPRGFVIDHKDNDGLNNTNENLRRCTQAQNCANRGPQRNNSSGYKGATWNATTKRWHSQGKVNGKLTCFGTFDTPEEAHAAYCMNMQQYHGEYFNNGGVDVGPVARLNAIYHLLSIKPRNRSITR